MKSGSLYNKRLFTQFTTTIIFCFALFMANAQQQKFYTIKGKIEGLSKATIYLSCSDETYSFQDSVNSIDGSFIFSGRLKEPVMYMLKTNQTQNATLLFYLEPGNVSINGSKDSLNKAIVKGSASNIAYKEWAQTWMSIASQAGPMYKRLDSATQNGKINASPEERKVFDDGMQSLSVQLNAAVMAFIKKYPQSPVSPFIIYDRYITYPDPEMAKKSFSMLGVAAKNSLYGKRITEYQRIAVKTGIGASHDFMLKDSSGKMVKLSSLRGNYVLVDFWASWCVPCRKENPNIVAAYRRFHEKGFDIISVSLDTQKEAWLKAIQMDGLTWKHVSDLKGWDSELVKEFGIKVVPTSFLLDRNGKVIAGNLRGTALHDKLEQLFMP